MTPLRSSTRDGSRSIDRPLYLVLDTRAILVVAAFGASLVRQYYPVSLDSNTKFPKGRVE